MVQSTPLCPRAPGYVWELCWRLICCCKAWQWRPRASKTVIELVRNLRRTELVSAPAINAGFSKSKHKKGNGCAGLSLIHLIQCTNEQLKGLLKGKFASRRFRRSGPKNHSVVHTVMTCKQEKWASEASMRINKL
jgi:hypothetical protein